MFMNDVCARFRVLISSSRVNNEHRTDRPSRRHCGDRKEVAASLDDVASQAAKAGVKAAGVVIDDTAVTPSYVIGFSAKRELPIRQDRGWTKRWFSIPENHQRTGSPCNRSSDEAFYEVPTNAPERDARLTALPQPAARSSLPEIRATAT